MNCNNNRNIRHFIIMKLSVVINRTSNVYNIFRKIDFSTLVAVKAFSSLDGEILSKHFI